jgi:uncharacterized protein (DUF486 family)
MRDARNLFFFPMKYLIPAMLLIISNMAMTAAWYGHLKFESKPLWIVILVSWSIALIEYCFQVPANRFGATHGLSVGQLKIMQEAITLIVFAVFVRTYFGQKLAWNYYVAFAFIFGAVFMVFFVNNRSGTE